VGSEIRTREERNHLSLRPSVRINPRRMRRTRTDDGGKFLDESGEPSIASDDIQRVKLDGMISKFPYTRPRDFERETLGLEVSLE
jgi:hypothetical protein